MDKILVKNIFAAVFNKQILDRLFEAFEKVRPSRRSHLKSNVRFWGTEGTVKYLVVKGFWAESVVLGFDFDGRVKSLDRLIFARILTDRTKNKHLGELKKLARYTFEVSNTPGVSHLAEPFDLVIVDLYAQDAKNFPESMDIGGQALIRAAVKNYKNVAVAFDKSSLSSLISELVTNHGSTTLAFRTRQAKATLKFIAERARVEAGMRLEK